MNSEDETSGVWKLTFPSEFATIHTDGHTADKIEITTHMNTQLEQGFTYPEPGVYPVKIQFYEISGDVLMFELSRWVFVTARLTSQIEQ